MTCRCCNLGDLHFPKNDHHPDVFFCNGGKKVCTLEPSEMKLLDRSPMPFCHGECAGFELSRAPKLSIVMPMSRRRDSVEMTLMALKIYHAEAMPHCELIVCDNEPTQSDHGKEIEKLLVHYQGTVRCKYVAFRDRQGTAVGKQQAIEAATGDAILCIDSHVMLPPGTVQRLIDFYEANPRTNDLYQGPCWRADLWDKEGKPTYNGSHFRPQWSGRMFGTWANDERVKDGEPFEIESQGMGLFSCRRDAWVGFDAESKGFGVEEFTTHAKFKARGDKTMLLPWLLWWHLFGHVETSTAGGKNWDRIENYIRSSLKTGVPDLAGIKQHFTVDFRDMTPAEFDAAVARLSPPKPARPAAGESSASIPAGYLTCPHRQASTGKSLDCNCSVDRIIYACSVHGKCLKKLPTSKTRKDFGKQLAGVTICDGCNDWKAPMKPAPTERPAITVKDPETLKLFWVSGDMSQGGCTRYMRDILKIMRGTQLDAGVMYLQEHYFDPFILSELKQVATSVEPYNRERFDQLVDWSDVTTSMNVNNYVPDHQLLLQRMSGKVFCQIHGTCDYTQGIMNAHRKVTRHFLACSKRASTLCKPDEIVEISPVPVDFNRVTRQRSKFDAKREFCGVGPDTKIVTYAGRLALEKGLLRICDTVKALPDDVKLLVVGGGYHEKELIPKMTQVMGDKLILRPWVNHPTDYLDATDVFLIQSDYEGVPLSLVEALCHGTTVVSVDVGVAFDYVIPQPGKRPFNAVFEFKGPETVAEALNCASVEQAHAIAEVMRLEHAESRIRGQWWDWLMKLKGLFHDK